MGAYASGLGPLLRPVKLAAGLADVATGQLGTLAAGLSETAKAGQVTTPRRVLFFKTKQVVPLRRSALTGWLNRQALIGPRPVTRNEGVLFTLKGRSWHHGTITFNVGAQSRTVSHLQSLSYPGRHYYFDRPLSRPQAVAVAKGRTKPESLPGYAGQLSRTDMLCPAWAGVKRALILTHLHWPAGQG